VNNWIVSRLDKIILFIVFLYYSIDMIQRGDNRFEIVRLQYFIISVVNLVVLGFIYLNKDQFNLNLKQILLNNLVSKLYVGFIALCGLSMIAAHNLSLAIVNFTQMLIICTMIFNLCILFHNRLHLIAQAGFIIGFVGLFQASLIFSQIKSLTDEHLIQQFLNGSVLEGNAGNMNIMSSGLLLKVPFILFAITQYQGFRKWFLSIALFFIFFCIFIINARTAIITLPVIFLVYGYYLFSFRKQLNAILYKVAFVFLPIIFSFLSANYVLQNSGREGRFESTAARVAQITLEQSSTQARFWFWENGIEIAKAHPVLGVGIGNWMIEQIPYGKNRYVFSINAHNDFIEILAETGWINGLLYGFIFILLFYINVNRIRANKSNLKQFIAFLALSLFLVYSIDALINFPLHRPTMQLGFAMLMMLTILNVNKGSKAENLDAKKANILAPKSFVSIKISLATIVLIGVVSSLILWQADRTAKIEFIVIKDKIDVNASGQLTGDQLANFQPKIPNVAKQTSISFDEYTGIYYFREKRYEDAIRYLDKGRSIHGKLGRENYYKYLIAEERRNPDSAYIYLNRTFQEAPFYEGWYNQFIRYAGRRKDTTHIFESYDLYLASARQPISNTFETTINALKSAGLKHASVLAFAERAAQNFPQDSIVNEVLNNLKITQYLVDAQAQYDLGNDKEAFELFQNALNVDTTNVFALQNMAIYYYNKLNYQKAIPIFKKAINKPGLSGGLTEYLLGVSLIQTGNQEEGCYFINLAALENFARAIKYYKTKCE
jgi:O-antigen ligase